VSFLRTSPAIEPTALPSTPGGKLDVVAVVGIADCQQAVVFVDRQLLRRTDQIINYMDGFTEYNQTAALVRWVR
jgi:hypothetical protein